MRTPPPLTVDDLKIVAAVNDQTTLSSCLAASPDIRSGRVPFRIYGGYRSASEAFNRALDETTAEKRHPNPPRVLVIAHQDVYLPAGFAQRLVATLNALAIDDADWAVAGCIGITAEGQLRGRTWASSMKKVLGSTANLPAVVASLDELILILNLGSTDAGFPRFDPELPSFHLYGTDIVQAARALNRRCYAIDLPVVHHSRPVVALGRGYWRAYRYCQAKWRESLPVATLMGGLHASVLPMLKQDVLYRLRSRGARVRRRPDGNPRDIASALGFDVEVSGGRE